MSNKITVSLSKTLELTNVVQVKLDFEKIEELRDSRLLFEKTVPPFGYFLIIIVTVFLVGIIIWSVYAVNLT